MDNLRFEEHRPHLRLVAQRILGSASDADDAVQEGWLRANAADTTEVENIGGWLTTVVSRVCLNMLRAQARRPGLEDDPVVIPDEALWPEEEVVLADSVTRALHVVLATLSPPERVAFVLHDVFAMPFDEIAAIIGRTQPATRQLASRARRRAQGGADTETDWSAHRSVMDAFFAAARAGDIDGLIAVLDPEVVLQTDRSNRRVVGAAAVARNAAAFAGPSRELHAALVDGAPGVVVTVDSTPVSVMAFVVQQGRITAIDSFSEPNRLARILPR
jgi:RNA polymerase sigma factor (sigma-70 family)